MLYSLKIEFPCHTIGHEPMLRFFENKIKCFPHAECFRKIVTSHFSVSLEDGRGRRLGWREPQSQRDSGEINEGGVDMETME